MPQLKNAMIYASEDPHHQNHNVRQTYANPESKTFAKSVDVIAFKINEQLHRRHMPKISLPK
jgi:hypothetical protein